MARNLFDIPKVGVFETNSKKSKKKCPATVKRRVRKRFWKDKFVGECFCCGDKPLRYDDVEGARIQAGGPYTTENVRLTCKDCNRGMGKTNMKVYMHKHFPERYKKYFPKIIGTKPKPRRKAKPYNPFGVNFKPIKF